MYKFRTLEYYGKPQFEIKRVNIEKETGKCIWIRGRRHLKLSSYYCYFDTWVEAHKYILRLAQQNVDFAQRQLNRYQSILKDIKQLLMGQL